MGAKLWRARAYMGSGRCPQWGPGAKPLVSNINTYFALRITHIQLVFWGPGQCTNTPTVLVYNLIIWILGQNAWFMNIHNVTVSRDWLQQLFNLHYYVHVADYANEPKTVLSNPKTLLF